MTVAQPALNPTVKLWAEPTHIYFDMTVDKPEDAADANQWRLSFNAHNFKLHIRDTILEIMTEMEAGVYGKVHLIG